jgi:hypothetical protein
MGMLRLETTARFRFSVGITAMLAASLIAGCCGSFGADSDEGCASCGSASQAADQDCTSRTVHDSGALDAADGAPD